MNKGKKMRLLACSLILLGMSGCSLVNKETKSENEAEIKLSFPDDTEQEKTVPSDLSRGDLLTMFEAVSNEEMVSFLYDDYNKDSVHEAFVLTKKEDDYTIWYMSSGGCEIVLQEIKEVDENQTDLLTFWTKDYVLIQYVEDGYPATKVYSVDNADRVIEPSISGSGYLIQNDKGEIEMRIYDRSAGEKKEDAYCTYYLHYLMDGGFREYGAIPISREQFLEFFGAGELLEEIEKLYEGRLMETSFLYRSNHYIHINFTILDEGRTDYRNMTVHYDNTRVEKVDKVPRMGRAEIAHMLEIATFPTTFKHPEQLDEQDIE